MLRQYHFILVLVDEVVLRPIQGSTAVGVNILKLLQNNRDVPRSFKNFLYIIQAQPSDFQIRAQKKQKTGHKTEICGPAQFKFMYKGWAVQGNKRVASFLFSLDQGRLVEGEV